MYYYLFEPNGNGKELAYTRIKSLINLHGITGEMGTPSATNTLEDLITKAADKGFNTIVAVGGDHFITSVAKLLAKSDIAFGVIPVGASQPMQELIGAKTLEQAVQALKQRKITETGMGVISPGKIFLLPATIQANVSTPVVITSKTFTANGSFTTLTIERQESATVRFSDAHTGPSSIKKFASWLFGKSAVNPSETVLRAPTLTITTQAPLPVFCHDQEIAKTPCKVRVIPNALKLIQARATMAETP